MTHDEECYRQYLANELKDNDTFQFECSMCGGCCRRRAEPVVINGPDLFRIAQALRLPPAEAAKECTAWDIGGSSHLPVLTLRERLDGSCRLLRKGRCTVHQNKPSVCALFPLGRMYNSIEDRFCYFKNAFCNNVKKSSAVRTWTMKEWLDEFGLRESEDDVRVWTRLVLELAKITRGMDEKEISGLLLDILLGTCYLQYDISKPYIPQVEAHMELLKDILPHIVRIPKGMRLFED